MITISTHSKLRYIQRVLGIEDEQKSIKYLHSNNQDVTLKIFNELSKSVLFLENFNVDGEAGKVMHVHIYKDIIFFISQNRNLITVWKMHHGAGEKYAETTEKALNQININKREIDKQKKNSQRIGYKGTELESTISNLYELISDLEQTNNEQAIQVVKKHIEKLWKERDFLKQEGIGSSVEVKALKNQNRQIMRDLMYGFVL